MPRFFGGDFWGKNIFPSHFLAMPKSSLAFAGATEKCLFKRKA